MYRKKKVYVVVPTFNEQGTIARVIKAMPRYVDRIIVVDDASTDRTYAMASALKNRRLRVVRHDVNQGVGGAVITGHRIVIRERADISVVIAGDDQMKPEHLPKLLDALIVEGYDYAKGNRFYRREYLAGMPGIRVAGNILLTLLNKLASGYWSISDPQNGYTAVRVDALRRLDLEDMSRDYQFENDMLLNLNIGDFLVKDVPIKAVYGEQKSKIRLLTFIPKTLAFMVSGLVRRMFYKYAIGKFHPIILLFIPGVLLSAFGLLFGVLAAYESIGPKTASTGTVMLSVLPLLLGAQMLIAALMLDFMESQRRSRLRTEAPNEAS